LRVYGFDFGCVSRKRVWSRDLGLRIFGSGVRAGEFRVKV